MMELTNVDAALLGWGEVATSAQSRAPRDLLRHALATADMADE